MTCNGELSAVQDRYIWLLQGLLAIGGTHLEQQVYDIVSYQRNFIVATLAKLFEGAY